MPKDPRVAKKKAAFHTMTDRDPLGVNKLQKGKSDDDQRKNIIYGLVCAIFLLMIISLMFFMIAHLEGATMGTQQDEVDDVINKKLADYIDHTPGAKNQSANKGSGAKATKEKDTIDSIALGLKFIPNMDNHKDILQRMTPVGGDSGYSGQESGIDYDMEALGEGTPRFHEWNGAKKMAFPVMYFDEAHVPIGDSVQYCMGVSWIDEKDKYQVDKYHDIRNMPKCEALENDRSQWEAEYPTHGINFFIWKQDFKKGDSGCGKGVYDSKADICYSYQIMTQVCTLIKFRHDPETNTYSWLYTGGCYKGNDAVHYEDASPQTTHTFKDVQFEVRFDNRDWSKITITQEEASIQEQEGNKEPKESEADKEAHKDETKQEKLIRKKREALEQEANRGGREYKPKGMYLFHQFFIFISILSLFIAIILVGILIWQVVKMAKSPAEDTQPLVQ